MFPQTSGAAGVKMDTSSHGETKVAHKGIIAWREGAIPGMTGSVNPQ